MHYCSSSGVNFTKILQAAFARADPISVKNTVKSLVSFYAFVISMQLLRAKIPEAQKGTDCLD